MNEEKLEKIQSMSGSGAIMELLHKEFNVQLEMLATIKSVESIMKFIMSGKLAVGGDYERYRTYRSLNEMRIEQNTVGGVTSYNITTSDGMKFVANSEYELISFCNQQMQAELLTTTILEIINKKGVNTNTKENPTMKFVRPAQEKLSLIEEPEKPVKREDVTEIDQLPYKKLPEIKLSETVGKDALMTSTLSQIKDKKEEDEEEEREQ